MSLRGWRDEHILKSHTKLTVDSAAAKGFISPINKNDSDIRSSLAPGVKLGERYRLITDAENPVVGSTVTFAGLVYEILRVEQVRIFGSFSHNECILRLKGERENA